MPKWGLFEGFMCFYWGISATFCWISVLLFSFCSYADPLNIEPCHQERANKVNHLQLWVLSQGKKLKLGLLWLRHLGNNAFLVSSLRKTHNGKGILLRAKAIYNSIVPDGKEAHLFQYSVMNVNNDCKMATIDFDEKCIVENGDTFFADEDTTSADYKNEMLNDGHQLFNVHLGHVNKRVMIWEKLKERKIKTRRSGPLMMCRT